MTSGENPEVPGIIFGNLAYVKPIFDSESRSFIWRILVTLQVFVYIFAYVIKVIHIFFLFSYYLSNSGFITLFSKFTVSRTSSRQRSVTYYLINDEYLQNYRIFEAVYFS